MNKPTLSVILPNYNHAHLIREALDAIFSQSFQPLEVIVVDDASTDNSISVIEEYSKKYTVIRLLKNDKNMGTNFSCNRALQLATGDYVYFPAADDRILPGFFEQSMTFLSEYPQAGLSFSDFFIYREKTGSKEKRFLGWSYHPIYYSPDELASQMRGWGMVFAAHSSIMKREKLIQMEGFRPELLWHADGFSCIVLAFRYGVVYIPDCLTLLRVRSDSYSAVRFKDRNKEKQALKVLLSYLDSDCRDIAALIKSSGFLGSYEPEILSIILSSPRYWKYLTPAFFKVRARWSKSKTNENIS